jgi:hypothetical protein
MCSATTRACKSSHIKTEWSEWQEFNLGGTVFYRADVFLQKFLSPRNTPVGNKIPSSALALDIAPSQSSSVGKVFSASLALGRPRTGSSLRILPSRKTSTRLANCAMSCS